MTKFAKIKFDRSDAGKEISPALFGSFIEHVGRCVYGGVYTPDTKSADEDGFNKNLIEACREMKLPLVRYPGGSYVSTWDWKNSIGPKNERKMMLNHPWHEMEPNSFGIGEAVTWCKKVGCELLMCLNISTTTVTDIMNLVEYCNFPKGTYWSDLRRSHGYEEPFNIKYWALGNEPDGWWQMNLQSSTEYARVTNEMAKAIKWIAPDVEVIACSSVGGNRDWTKETLLKSYKYIDHLSVHDYIANKADDFEGYMAEISKRVDTISAYAELCDEVKDELGSDKTVNLSFDEWNVWYHSIEADKLIKFWEFAPHRLEDVYNLEDALVIGDYVITMLKLAERMKIGCMAQLVNVLGPFMTDDDGNLLKQTTYYPYSDACRYGRGTAFVPEIECDTFSATSKGEEIKNVPCISCAAAESEDAFAIFIVNRSKNDGFDCEIDISGIKYSEISAKELYHDDIKAINSFSEPCNVEYKPLDVKTNNEKLTVSLKKHSWNVIILKK